MNEKLHNPKVLRTVNILVVNPNRPKPDYDPDSAEEWDDVFSGYIKSPNDAIIALDELLRYQGFKIENIELVNIQQDTEYPVDFIYEFNRESPSLDPIVRYDWVFF